MPEEEDAPARVVIVDDEPLARRRIRRLLSSRDDVTLIAECGAGDEAVRVLEKLECDLLFLDIRMPGKDGFEVLRSLETERPPLVVFVTAFNDYAIQAFEAHALDYLLKPFEDERFFQCLDRGLERVRLGRRDQIHRGILHLLGHYRGESSTAEEPVEAKPSAPERLIVKSSGSILFLDPAELDWVQAEGSYLWLHVGETSHLHRETLKRLEDRLPPDRFLRIHRSTIVNLEKVREVKRTRHGEYRVCLTSGATLNVSLSRREALERALKIR